MTYYGLVIVNITDEMITCTVSCHTNNNAFKKIPIKSFNKTHFITVED